MISLVDVVSRLAELKRLEQSIKAEQAALNDVFIAMTEAKQTAEMPDGTKITHTVTRTTEFTDTDGVAEILRSMGREEFVETRIKSPAKVYALGEPAINALAVVTEKPGVRVTLPKTEPAIPQE